MSNFVLEIRHLNRTFPQQGGGLTVLSDVNLSIEAGEIVALIGPSGTGKSTLLQIAGLLEPPTRGDVLIQGKSSTALKDYEKTKLRSETIGFVYQFHHLLPEFTALENVMLPQLIAGVAEKEARGKALKLLSDLGLKERADHRPAQLSGGEQQRVAILRALANNPRLLLADEPTGNLDEATAEVVFRELVDLVRSSKMAALIATHNPDLSRRMDRTLLLHNGAVEPKPMPTLTPISGKNA